jgi:hypothetical protein
MQNVRAILIAFHDNSQPTTPGGSGAQVRAADPFEASLEDAREVGDVMAKALVTSVAFSGADPRATDGYVVTVTFRGPGQEPTTKVYRHTVHSTSGNPPGQPFMTIGLNEAFSAVVEQLTLGMLVDLQREERR